MSIEERQICPSLDSAERRNGINQQETCVGTPEDVRRDYGRERRMHPLRDDVRVPNKITWGITVAGSFLFCFLKPLS